MNAKLQEEVAARIEIMKGDPHFQEDNPNMSERDYEFTALNDIRALGDDFGGHFVSPFLNEKPAREWRAIRRAAIRWMQTMYSSEYADYCVRMAELDRQFPATA